tara:strand:- start:5650 stop:6117 length:468 start_codon:yes stop_codon:yes gene_type:complete
MRTTNIDTLSALLDRLVSERIKLFFFNKDKDYDKIEHQEIVLEQIKNKISYLLDECLTSGKYEYISEKRTFKSSDIAEELENLVVNDIIVGESDRGVLKEIVSDEPNLENLVTHAKRMRKANEGRAESKNKLDNQLEGFADAVKRMVETHWETKD